MQVSVQILREISNIFFEWPTVDVMVKPRMITQIAFSFL